jgi:predicted cobalt transporter CbtA
VEKKLISLGLMAGLLGGLASFAFARLQVTPVIRRAIEFEEGGQHREHEHEQELFTRAVQENVGTAAGTVVFAMAVGAIFAVAFITGSMRLSRRGISVDPRWTALLLAGAGFVTVNLFPFLLYPANPPGVGLAETIGDRTSAYLVTVGLSVTLAIVAIAVTVRLVPRIGGWAAAGTGVLGYVAATSIAAAALPRYDETPAGFPADVLSDFRMYSILSQAILWLVIGAIFAGLLPRRTGAVHAHP